MHRIEYITAITSRAMDIPAHQVINGRRTQPAVNARTIVALLAKEEGYSSPEIAKFLNRTHSAILYAQQRAADWLDTDKKFRANFKKTKEMLNDKHDGTSSRLRVLDNINVCLSSAHNLMKRLEKEITELSELKSELNK